MQFLMLSLVSSIYEKKFFKNRLKFLIAGYGSIGKRHLKNILSNSNSKIIVYSKRKDLSNLEKKNIKIFDSLDKCLAEKPNAGFITNETSYHVPVSKKLAQAGLDLFIEKPLSNSIRLVSDLVKTTKNKKLVTLMGCNLRFHDCIKKIKTLIEQQKIGKILSVQVECGTYLPDWHPNEDYSKGYSARDDLGGGVVLTCIHEIDYLYWFFGDVKEVFSITGKFSNLKVNSSDLSAIIMRFHNNVIAEVHLDYFQKPETRSCKIIGTKGTIVWNSVTNEVKLYNLKNKKWSTKLKIINYKKNDMYKKELAHFIHCIKNKKKSQNDIFQGQYVLKIALGIIKSSKLKRVVTIGKN